MQDLSDGEVKLQPGTLYEVLDHAAGFIASLPSYPTSTQPTPTGGAPLH